jgi:hypothetical protein
MWHTMMLSAIQAQPRAVPAGNSARWNPFIASVNAEALSDLVLVRLILMLCHAPWWHDLHEAALAR